MTTAAPERIQVRESFRIAEAALDGRTLRLTVIQAGFNTSRRHYYTAESLQAAASMFAGVKMYQNHPTDEEEWSRPEGSLNDWVANLVECEWDEAAQCLRGSAILVDPQFTAKIAQLDETGQLGTIGVSIRAWIVGEDTTIDDHVTMRVDEFFNVISTDFVTEPGAGGRVIARESAQPESTPQEGNMATEDLLRQVTEAQAAQAAAMTRATEAEARATAADAARDAAVTAQRDAEARAIAAEESLRTAQAEAAMHAAQGRIAEAINAAEISDAARTRLRESLASETDVERATAMIATVVEAVRESGGGRVAGNGETTPANTPGSPETIAALESQRIEAYKRRGWDEKSARDAVMGRN